MTVQPNALWTYVKECSKNRTIPTAGKISELVDNGANINARDEFGETLLMYACKNENYFLIKPLIDKGADLDMQDTKGKTALMWAVISGKADNVKLLINAGADMFIHTVQDRRNGESAQGFAIKYNKKEIA